MAISSDAPAREPAAIPNGKENGAAIANESAKISTPPKTSSESKKFDNVDNTAEFEGEVNTNNDLPTQQTLQKIQNLPILDADGKSIPFKNLYTGPNVARRVLVIFIRHFYCGVSLSPDLKYAVY